ncbi:MAG: hypothetical protein QXX87_00685 [Candidatus Jordarchaeales archaeon]
MQRSDRNPILKPNPSIPWEAEAVFNGCPAKKDGKIYLLYRALSSPETINGVTLRVSRIGLAESEDGVEFYDRRMFIYPEQHWERFGCEDPRITELDGKYYIFYTALSHWPPVPEGIRVGVAISRDLRRVEEKHLVTPFNAKAMALFPERINGKLWAVLTVHTDRPPARICLASFDSEEDIWSEDYWREWYPEFEKHSLPLQRRPQDHIEVGAPPLETPYGWLLIYSYIRDYFSPQKRLFGVEAVLLDLHNPMKILARTDAPILTPGEYYERIGMVPNVVFPSGALLEDDTIYLYYGAADTTCCLAYINLPLLIWIMREKPVKPVRSPSNPIITPVRAHYWESKATFNPAAIYLNGKVHIIYRAMSEDNTSVLGYAVSEDGVKISYRSPEPIYVPRAPFEKKAAPGLGSGCEDPRVVLIGDRIYMTYTAYDGLNARVALTSISVDDFLAGRWDKWAYPVIISPYDVFDKNSCIFPEKYKGNYIIIHRIGECIDYELREDLDFTGKPLKHYPWILPRKGMWDSKKVGIGPPPIRIKEGWLLFYHGVSEEGVYRVGVLLLDPENPLKVLARSEEPLMEPEEWYERWGQVPNVVFPCGAVLIDDTIYIYYGGADTVVGVATISVRDVLRHLGIEPAPEWTTLEGFIPGAPLTLPAVITTIDGRTFRTEEVYRAVYERRRKEFEKFLFERLKVPRDAPPSTIISAVRSVMEKLEAELGKVFKGDLYTREGVEEFVKVVLSHFPHGKTFALKTETVQRILQENPPINLPSKFACTSIEEVPCEPRDALALASFSEGREYDNRIWRWLESNVKPEHFEETEIKCIVVEHEFLPTVLELREGTAISRLTGRIVVSTLRPGVGGEFPRLRAFIRIVKHIVELERFGEMWKSFAEKRKFGVSVANSLREHWGIEPLSAHSVFENKNHRVMVERLKSMAGKLRESGYTSLAEALEDMLACYALASTLPDGTFLPCSAWTWTLHSYRGGKGVPPAFIAYVERDWATRDLLNELFRRAGISEEEIDRMVIELIRRGKEPENIIKQLFE